MAKTPPGIDVELSLILPVVNGAGFIAQNVAAIVAMLEAAGRTFELIVVSDGSIDDTPARATESGDHRIRVLHHPVNVGKGYAVCVGIAHARGRYIGWLDADLDIAPEAVVAAMLVLDRSAADAAIGSKRHPDSHVEYPMIRRFLSVGYYSLVRLLLRVDVRDTQTGAKVYRREVLDTVAPLLLIKRYAFDLEVLAVAAEFGFDRIQEIPIRLRYQRFTGTGITSRAVRNMFIDTLAIAYRIHIRHWYVRQFAQLQRERMAAAAESLNPPVPRAGTMYEVLAALEDPPSD
jgi:glycosyltransferase involved in cell wall biosynthesis